MGSVKFLQKSKIYPYLLFPLLLGPIEKVQTAASYSFTPVFYLCWDGQNLALIQTNSPLHQLLEQPETGLLQKVIVQKLATCLADACGASSVADYRTLETFSNLIKSASKGKAELFLYKTETATQLFFALRITFPTAEKLDRIVWPELSSLLAGKEHQPSTNIIHVRHPDGFVIAVERLPHQSRLQIVSLGQATNRTEPLWNALNEWLAGHKPPITGQPIFLELICSLDSLFKAEGLKQGNGHFFLSEVHAIWYPKGSLVRTEAALRLAGQVDLTSSPWQVPTNIIREPLISFTAVRGLRALLNGSNFLPSNVRRCAPEQLYAWAVGNHPFGWFAVADMNCPIESFAASAPEIEQRIKDFLPGLENVRLVFQQQHSRLIISNLTFAVPFLAKGPGADTNLTVFGLSLPLNVSGSPPPPELLNQLNVPGLVCYHWELTEQRLPHLFLTYMFYIMQGGFEAPPEQGVINGWLLHTNITARLGNTVTKVVQTSPNSLSLERSSVLGFSSAELLLLANWLDGEDFPLWTPPKRPAAVKTKAAPLLR